jgi:hypothetical protein
VALVEEEEGEGDLELGRGDGDGDAGGVRRGKVGEGVVGQMEGGEAGGQKGLVVLVVPAVDLRVDGEGEGDGERVVMDRGHDHDLFRAFPSLSSPYPHPARRPYPVHAHVRVGVE